MPPSAPAGWPEAMFMREEGKGRRERFGLGTQARQAGPEAPREPACLYRYGGGSDLVRLALAMALSASDSVPLTFTSLK